MSPKASFPIAEDSDRLRTFHFVFWKAPFPVAELPFHEMEASFHVAEVSFPVAETSFCIAQRSISRRRRLHSMSADTHRPF
jgi:hypothetical protein